MNINLKFGLWIAGVAMFALAIAAFVPSKPIATAPQHGVHAPVKTGGRGGTVSEPQSQPAATTRGRGAAPIIEELSYSALITLISGDERSSIKSLSFVNGSAVVMVSREGKPDARTVVPDDGGKQELRTLAQRHGVPFVVKPQPEPGPNFLAIFSVVGTFLIIMLIGFSVLRARAAAGGGGIMGVANSPGRRVDQLGDAVPKVKFTDVAGCDEAVKELRRVVTGLVGKDVYDSFDAELPNGILLVGPPGTGKTLLAKATAGESDGTMDIMSGSDFVFMLVGVGAGRVRDAFAKARKAVAETGKPHIIFIDEIDAVGGKRGGGATGNGGNQEREQTLNQLLVEMDGVASNKGILVMAATNRVDMLDDALLRPGRFDCQVRVDLPDRKGREAIFAIHTRKKPLHPEVTLPALAARSYGYSGAEIKGASNRAAIISAERWAEQTAQMREAKVPMEEILKQFPRAITLLDFDEGLDFVRHGNAEPDKQANMPKEQKLNTAGHEAGHANAADVMPGCDPVVKITIMRRARALGYVQSMPDTDRVGMTDKELVARIVMAMSGRAAQEVLFNVKDNGASNDFEQANNLIHLMVTRWGMSRLGNIFVGEAGPSPLGGPSGSGLGCGAELADQIDREKKRIRERCYEIALHIARADKARLEKLTEILMEDETMLADKWQEFVKANPSSVKAEDVAFDPSAPDAVREEAQ
jgi:cell division protease FtsH